MATGADHHPVREGLQPPDVVLCRPDRLMEWVFPDVQVPEAVAQGREALGPQARVCLVLDLLAADVLVQECPPKQAASALPDPR